MNFKHFISVSAVALLLACNTGNATGYVPTPQEIQQIQVGGDTKESIQQKFGAPSSVGQSEDHWYYIAQQRRYPGSLPTREIDRRILVIRFSGDQVAGVTEFGQEQGKNVPISRYTTETGGRELSIWQQLVGSVGNFSAESFVNQINSGDITTQ